MLLRITSILKYKSIKFSRFLYFQRNDPRYNLSFQYELYPERPFKLSQSFLTQKSIFSFSTAFNSKKDYYKILNVAQTATAQQIKKSFLKLAKQYHPDTNKGNQQKFKQINQAYQVLSSQSMRRDYDDVRRAQRNQTNNPFGNASGYKQENYRQTQQQNTYRGYERDQGWNNKNFRHQNMQDLFRRQQQQFTKYQNSKTNWQHDDNLSRRSSSSYKGQDLQQQLQKMFRQNAQKIKITRQSVRKAVEQQQKRREKMYKEYQDRQQKKSQKDFEDRIWKMAQGAKNNVEGMVRAAKYAKQSVQGAVKVGKILKGLWDQYKKGKK